MEKPSYLQKLRGRLFTGRGAEAPSLELAQRFEQIISERLVKVVFQPIVDVRNGKVFAYECLARSQAPDYNGPLPLFRDAVACGMVGRLGQLLRQMAVDECAGYPLFLNIHPNEFDEGWLVQPTDAIFQHTEPVYLEITESVPLSHFEQCHGALREIRGKGVRLAVDDLGAGYSNLKYISDLAPEVVKLDRELIMDVHTQPRQQKLLQSIVRLCVDMGAKVVAEGIEKPEELEVAIAAGVHYVQGYLLAYPEYPPPVPRWPAG